MSNVTPGPWRHCGKALDRVFIQSQHVRHINNNGDWHDVAYMAVSNGADENDADLIVTAVNACFSISPSNPELVAGGIEEMVDFIRECAEGMCRGQETAQTILNRMGIR